MLRPPARRRTMAVSLAACCAPLVLVGPALAPARAQSLTELAQRAATEQLLPKLELACGIAPARALTLSIEYDAPSLSEHDPTIRNEQTDGAQECNEPLRYLWYACQTPAGKAAVSAANIQRVVCKGTTAPVGSLRVERGTITVERSAHERDPYKRSRKQFEAALHVSLRFGRNGSPNPYYDADWNELRRQPNPVTSTSDYCLVNGEKQAYDARLVDRLGYKSADAKLQCWKNRQLIIDLAYHDKRKTGFVTEFTMHGSRYSSYRDNKLHGEQQTVNDGRVTTQELYDNGERLWTKNLDERGQITEYKRRFAQGQAGFLRKAGKYYSLECRPQAVRDEVLHRVCGFDGPTTTEVYDGTERINHIDTWEEGILRRRAAGDSRYAARSTVDYVAGEKHGVERVLAEDGSLAAIIPWKHGVKDGEELSFANREGKVAKASIWKAGDLQHLTEYYLNGNPKREEWYDRPGHRRVRTFWDTGKVAMQGEDTSCTRGGSRSWCEDRVRHLYFEDGTPKAELQYKLGERHGPNKTWWGNGKLAASDDYEGGRIVRSQHWNEGGTLVTDEEYEADGSVRLRH